MGQRVKSNSKGLKREESNMKKAALLLAVISLCALICGCTPKGTQPQSSDNGVMEVMVPVDAMAG